MLFSGDSLQDAIYSLTFEHWSAKVSDRELAVQLTEMAHLKDERVIKDAFYRDLEFGTGGLRGIIGVGSNRMNIYTVSKATQGLANYLNSSFSEPAVAIARDSRTKGELFCMTAAAVLAANGIKSYLYPRIEPTPALSWAVRDLQCCAGICVTASHNPSNYNGYKVYGPDGCQITTQAAASIQKEINIVDTFGDVKTMSIEAAFDQGMVSWISENTLDRYIDAVFQQSVEAESNSVPFKVAYTPLHGAGLECVVRVLEKSGIDDICIVSEQSEPDGSFPTCAVPNPEEHEALQLGIAICKDIQADLLLATDPDADRIGVAVRNTSGYELLTGNEIGILLLDYICHRRLAKGLMPVNPIAISTIVSSAMADAVAKKYGVEMRRTLTGFKYIGEQISLLETENTVESFIFGFEESYGYLSGAHVRDKDAVNAALLLAQMAAYYKSKDMTLNQVIDLLYQEHGYYKNSLLSVSYTGAEGAEVMRSIMNNLRNNPPASVAGHPVLEVVDYSLGINGLSPSQVLEFILKDHNKILIRPSGTEPKIKAYLFSCADSVFESEMLCTQYEQAAKALLHSE